MNQTFQPGTAESVDDKALPLPPPLATRRDIEALANALIKGENAVVRRREALSELRSESRRRLRRRNGEAA